MGVDLHKQHREHADDDRGLPAVDDGGGDDEDVREGRLAGPNVLDRHGNASASVAATSSNSAGPARVVTPSQKAKPTTTAAAAITGATTGHVPAGAAPRARAIRFRRSPEPTTPSAATDMTRSIARKGVGYIARKGD